ncbi:hypothetical protein JB92DRAFT_3109691 [Gautieria morchelliformis]|nr:hypothetical protein JB92DRAFT_3109691 [Gautieria morchelliformis]
MTKTDRMELNDALLQLMLELILKEDAELDVYLEDTDSETGASSDKDMELHIFDGEAKVKVIANEYYTMDNYLVKWAGYANTNEETSWISAMELNHTSELISDFHKAYPTKHGPLPKH